MITLGLIVVALVAGFVTGVLFGRKNKSKVEAAVKKVKKI